MLGQLGFCSFLSLYLKDKNFHQVENLQNTKDKQMLAHMQTQITNILHALLHFSQ